MTSGTQQLELSRRRAKAEQVTSGFFFVGGCRDNITFAGDGPDTDAAGTVLLINRSHDAANQRSIRRRRGVEMSHTTHIDTAHHTPQAAFSDDPA